MGTLTMEIDDPIVALREKVTGAQQEFDMAVAFHEVWKPAAYNPELHSRMGKSYASQAFLVTRTALRREMVLALTRLWDTNPRAIRMQSVADTLRKKEVIDALATARVSGLGLPRAVEQMKDDMDKRATEVIRLVNKYMEGGSHDAVLKKLLALRHKRLAHRQLAPAAATGANASDKRSRSFTRIIQSSSASSPVLSTRWLMTRRIPPRSTGTTPATFGRVENRPKAIRTTGRARLADPETSGSRRCGCARLFYGAPYDIVEGLIGDRSFRFPLREPFREADADGAHGDDTNEKGI